jgi:probable blue pigment (indigoidine) exporter
MKRVDSAGNSSTAALTLLAPISWGTTYLTITELLPQGRPLFVAAMRVMPAGLVVLALSAHRSWEPPTITVLKRHALLGLFNFGIFFPLLAVAVYRLPGGVAAAAGGVQPLLVAMLSWRINHQRPSGTVIIVGVVAALGVALVVIHPDAHLDAVGVLAALIANASFAVGVVLTKKWPTPVNRLAATGWQLVLGGLVLIPLTAIVEGVPPSLSSRNVTGFAYLSGIGTALAFVVWFNGIRRLPASAPPLLGLAAPITGAALGWLVLGQALSPLQLLGITISVTAIAYGATVVSKKSHRHDSHQPMPGKEVVERADQIRDCLCG